MHVVNIGFYKSKEKLTEVFGDRLVYIGRRNIFYGFEESPLHNPYIIKLGVHRNAAISFYEKYLRSSLEKGDALITETMKSLSNRSVLVCYCHPKRCHGNVIDKVWKEYRDTWSDEL